ncbi:MAG TPA: S8 family serine peptidase, partial [Ilumatobacteraceae bacterium]|nr:S8 family serine peptidase [Ilumatobacteraceae bacterium]
MRKQVLSVAVFVALAAAPPALADFPYAHQGTDPSDYTDLYLENEEPDDVGEEATLDDNGGGEYWKYSASPEPTPQNALNDVRPAELGGVRGASLFDFNEGLDWAWQVSTGRPDVTIAVLDSGIEWDNAGAMTDLRFKTRINRGEAPVPLTNRTDAEALVGGTDCDAYADVYDANDDGVFNLRDYACDLRVNVTDPRRVGPVGTLIPQDVLIAFSDGVDDDDNGFVDDMVGWDFLDDDNDPFDDVGYGHGTGEAEGSNGEAGNGNTIGSCPNCTVIHMRVGDSFIADVNRFAAAVVYAVDNGALVIQSALGTLNNTSLAR